MFESALAWVLWSFAALAVLFVLRLFVSSFVSISSYILVLGAVGVAIALLAKFNLSLSGPVQITTTIDAIELEKVKSSVAELNRRLFGEGAEGTADRLGSLASLLQDTASMDRKIKDVKGLLQDFEASRLGLEDFLQAQLNRSEALVKVAVERLLDVVAEERFWRRLQPQLQMLGLLTSPNVTVMVEVEMSKARVIEELRIKHGVDVSIERVKGEAQILRDRASSQDFDERLAFRAAWLLFVCAVILATLFGLRLIYQLLLQRLKIPPLVDETSVSWWNLLNSFSRTYNTCLPNIFSGNVKDGQPKIVLQEKVRESVSDMAHVASLAGRCSGKVSWSCRSASISSRHLALPNALFYGPPGTGKSLTARRLALACGLDFALMSGGNVLSLREDAVPELRRVFGWARRAPSGLVLFIDEAEAFLGCRGAGNHFLQAAMSFFLSQTTASSTKLLLILATNRPQDLDEAVLSRLSFQIEFGKPSQDMIQELIEDRLRFLDDQASSRLSQVLRECQESLIRLNFAGRDIQSLVEEFQRRWHLEKATCGLPNQKLADKQWLMRWLEHRQVQ